MKQKFLNLAMIVMILSALSLGLFGCNKTDKNNTKNNVQGENQTVTEENPWDKKGAKQPADYTWAEFEALSGAQQIAFQNDMGADGFEEWMNRAQGTTVEKPWDKKGAKQPADYTWEEFESLTGEQQIAFQNDMGADEFENWMNRAQNKPAENPWDKKGAKQPADYTWAEFEALEPSQQIEFQTSFDSIEAFDAWLVANQPE